MNAIDTNIMVYALSADEPARSQVAAALLEKLSARDTVLLWQVACEFGAVISKLHAKKRVTDEAFQAVAAVRERFTLVLPTEHVLDLGMRLHREQQVSYWDAMLIAACADAGVTRLYSEDVPARAQVAQVEIVNPFRA